MSYDDRHIFLQSGNRALDLLNTRQGPGAEAPDQLRSPHDLVTWLRAAGLLVAPEADARLTPPGTRILLTEAHRLRDDIARLVEAKVSGEAPPSHLLFAINRVLGASRVSLSLLGESGQLTLVEREASTSLLGVLAPVARAAADLILDADPARIRRCASGACRRWFVDTSKGGRRKWCSMATCGNRAKAETHRRGRRPA
jgi:predicted RNA-binding Zn ribbon-like protein